MAKYRDRIGDFAGIDFLSDGGMETTLIFLEGTELPLFAAFDLMKDEAGRAQLTRYYEPYAHLARRCGAGFIFETPTWRANADWGAKLGYDAAALADVNRRSIDLVAGLRARFETAAAPMLLSGAIGPRGDGYQPGAEMAAREAAEYHGAQIRAFADTEADLVSAFTLNYAAEGTGIALAARKAGMPVVLSFTLETDGRLPTGQPLGEAIAEVDAATGAAPAYYMVNCAHPTHFDRVLMAGGDWAGRIRGIRANASCRSHAELDAAPDLDAGDPAELGRQYRDLRRGLRHLNVFGGCCGTDFRHVEEIAFACLEVPRAA